MGCNGGDCVMYGGGNCPGNGDGYAWSSNYIPNCSGNCFQFDSFDWVEVQWGSLEGVNCNVYSDYNCQDYMGGAGDSEYDACTWFGGAQSMICWAGC